MTNQRKLELLAIAFYGTDIKSLHLAQELRKADKKFPGLFHITPQNGEYKVTDSKPYFSAIVTNRGKAVLKKAAWCNTFNKPAYNCDCPDCGTTLVDYSG